MLKIVFFHGIYAVAHDTGDFPHIDTLLRHERRSRMTQNMRCNPAQAKVARPIAEGSANLIARLAAKFDDIISDRHLARLEKLLVEYSINRHRHTFFLGLHPAGRIKIDSAILKIDLRPFQFQYRALA